MTKLKSGSAAFRGTTGAQSLVASITQPGTYTVVHGQACKVCEANAVYVRALDPLELWKRSGTYTLSCSGDNVAHNISSSAAFIEVQRSDTNDLTGRLQATTLDFLSETISFATPGTRTASAGYAESLWPCAAVRGLSDSSQSAFVFYEETISSSISAEQYVATVLVDGAYVSYAGAGLFKAGYVVDQPLAAGGDGAGATYFVNLFDTYSADESYVDAKPFHSPEFNVVTTNNSQLLGQGSGRFQSSGVTLIGLSMRAGALDRVASAATPLPTGVTAQADRKLPPCDYNSLTLRQNKVERHIFRDSALFKYGTAIELSLKNGTVGNGQAAVSAGLLDPTREILDEVFWPELPANQRTSSFRQSGDAHIDGACGFSVFTHTPLRVASGPYTLTHALHDGRLAIPREWHYSAESQLPTVSYARGAVRTSIGFMRDYVAQADATDALDRIENSSAWDGSYFSPTVEVTNTPKRVQLRAQVFHNTQTPLARAQIRLDYRFTGIVTASFQKHPLELRSVNVTDRGGVFAARWLLAADFGYAATGQDLFTRSYLHEVYGFTLFYLTQSEWQEQAMAGQAVEVTSQDSGARIAIRLVSA